MKENFIVFFKLLEIVAETFLTQPSSSKNYLIKAWERQGEINLMYNPSKTNEKFQKMMYCFTTQQVITLIV